MSPRATKRPLELRSLHVPLGLSVAAGLKLLRELEMPIDEHTDDEHHFRVDARGYSVALYPKGDRIGSVWYDDPTGRDSSDERLLKVEAYLARYGELKNWRKGMTNGWMDYWYNDTDKVGMVHGLHMDVIRFNAVDA